MNPKRLQIKREENLLNLMSNPEEPRQVLPQSLQSDQDQQAADDNRSVDSRSTDATTTATVTSRLGGVGGAESVLLQPPPALVHQRQVHKPSPIKKVTIVSAKSEVSVLLCSAVVGCL